MKMNLQPKRILLIHGWGGKKNKHWLTWVEQELLECGYEVLFPKIPNSYNPNLKKWLNHLEKYVEDFQPDIVIAHSLGALAWWHFYDKSHYQLKQLISVAPPTFPSFISKMATFFPLPEITFEPGIQTIIYALNDPNIISYDIKTLALKMKSHLIKKGDGGHLDHFSKTDTLPEVLKIIK